MSYRCPVLAAIAILFLIGAHEYAEAQTNERAYESFASRPLIPGARAIGMGKAFVGIADDATAAASNPAGLSNLLDPEVSFEWAHTDLKTERMIGLNPLRTVQSSVVVQFPTFGSAVLPLGRLTLAGFHFARQRYKEEFRIPNFDSNGTVPQGGYYGDMDISVAVTGFGGSFIFTNRLSIGATVTLNHLNAVVNSNSSDANEPGQVHFRSGTVTTGDATELSSEVGVLFKATPQLTIGAALQPGVTFKTTTEIKGVFSTDPVFDPTTNRFRNLTLPVGEILGHENTKPTTDFRVPTRATIGASMRLSPNLLVLADTAFVRYSERITPNFLIVDFLAQPSAGLSSALYKVNNGVEIHVGGEYRLRRVGRLIALRAGLFTDPDHQMRFDLAASNGSEQARGQAVQFNSFVPGTAVGYSVGAGTVFRNRLQVDAAYSRSMYERDLIVSTVFRF